MKAVILVELCISLFRTVNFDIVANSLAMHFKLDLRDEKREHAAIRITHYKDQVVKVYNRNVQPRQFNIGDLVLRRICSKILNIETLANLL